MTISMMTRVSLVKICISLKDLSQFNFSVTACVTFKVDGRTGILEKEKFPLLLFKIYLVQYLLLLTVFFIPDKLTSLFLISCSLFSENVRLILQKI